MGGMVKAPNVRAKRPIRVEGVVYMIEEEMNLYCLLVL